MLIMNLMDHEIVASLPRRDSALYSAVMGQTDVGSRGGFVDLQGPGTPTRLTSDRSLSHRARRRPQPCSLQL
jgi:hypothetical protein